MNSQYKENRLPYGLAIFIGILAVSTASIFIRFAQTETPSLVIASFRLFFASLFLLPLMLRHSSELSRLDRRTLSLMILSGIFLAFHFATWITSLEYTSVASSVVLVTTAPLWVALFSPLFLKEHVSRWTFVGIGIALLGGIIVSASDACLQGADETSCSSLINLYAGNSLKGNLLALAGALFSAAYMMIGRKVRPHQSLLVYTFMVYSIATIILVALTLGSGFSFIGYLPITYIWLLLLAIIPQLIGHSAFNYSLKYAKASMVSIALLGEPIGTILLAIVFLDESPTTLEIIGGVLILAGILIVSRLEKIIEAVS
jgi:drug/metabolite transporter (DMT)-like permease